jgi:hypothetical protein
MNTTTKGTPFAVAVVVAFCALCYALATDCDNRRLRRENAKTKPARDAYWIGRVDGIAFGFDWGARRYEEEIRSGERDPSRDDWPPVPRGYRRTSAGWLEYIGDGKQPDKSDGWEAFGGIIR